MVSREVSLSRRDVLKLTLLGVGAVTGGAVIGAIKNRKDDRIQVSNKVETQDPGSCTINDTGRLLLSAFMMQTQTASE